MPRTSAQKIRPANMILFVLYEFVSNKKKGASGGNISNYLLIDYLRRHKNIAIIAPNICKDLKAALEKHQITVITESLEFKTPLHRFKKREWIKKTLTNFHINYPNISSKIEIIVSSNGTSDLTAHLGDSNTKIYILCRAFEDFYNHNSHYPLKEKFKRAFVKLFTARKISNSYKNADKIITNSEFMKEFIRGHYSTPPISVLYPPIDLPLKAFKAIPLQPRIGIINPSERKGEGIFIALAKAYPNCTFVYFSQHTKKYSSTNIVYGGWHSDREVLFSQIDILLAPSVWSEPFGRVSVEAIRSGIPVLVSNVGGLPETVDSVFVVLNQSIDEWAKQLEWLIGNPCQVEDAWDRSVLISKKFEQSVHDINALNIFI